MTVLSVVTDNDRTSRIAEVGYDYTSRRLERVTRCNLCGSTRHVEVARRDRYGFPAVFRVCGRCGLGFLAPRLAASEYAAFYESIYRPLVSAYHGRRIDAETVQDDQRIYAAELVSFLQDTLPAWPRSVLDVGGSTGVVAGAVRSAFGSAATVLDPSPDELAVAAAARMETIAGFAEDYVGSGRRFDLVLLCQTIDHLLDVARTLEALRGLVADVGRVFVDVLDVRFMTQRRGVIEEAVKIDHPYYLTRDTALAYFRRAGFDVVAERLSDDGHWGFLLAPSTPHEPDWPALKSSADAFLAEVWRMRAEGR
jgi:SAM-dependent methyltransferase